MVIRSPHAIRPWQHVLEPLRGYLSLAEQLWVGGQDFAEAWNFGPEDRDARPVQWVVERLAEAWGGSAGWHLDDRPQPHEATYLKLDCSKAATRLSWRPRWDLATALQRTVAWYQAHGRGEDMRTVTLEQIATYSQCLD